jgi:hypothetical protein
MIYLDKLMNLITNTYCNDLANAVNQSGLFKKIDELKENPRQYNIIYWHCFEYNDSFTLFFNTYSTEKFHSELLIKDIRNSSPFYHGDLISLEQFLEYAPEDLRTFIVFNIDLFSSAEIPCIMAKK